MAGRLSSTARTPTATTAASRVPATRAKVSPARRPEGGSSSPAVKATGTLAPRAVRFSWVAAIMRGASSTGAMRLSKRVKTQHTARFSTSSRHSRTMTRGERAVSRSKSSRYKPYTRYTGSRYSRKLPAGPLSAPVFSMSRATRCRMSFWERVVPFLKSSSPFLTVTGVTLSAAAVRAFSVSTSSTTAEATKNLSIRFPASSVLLTAGRLVCFRASLAR